MDSKGRFLFAKEVAYLGDFHDGLARFKYELRAESRSGFVDRTGKVVLAPVWTTQANFSDGLLAVEINGKYGFVSKTGEMLIPAIFDEVYSPFDRGLSYVRLGSSEGYIDVKGNWVRTPPVQPPAPTPNPSPQNDI